MLQDVPASRVRSKLKEKIDRSVSADVLSLMWLNYELFLKRLSKMAADNARADKSSVIRPHHVIMAKKFFIRILPIKTIVWKANCKDPDVRAPIGSLTSGSLLFTTKY